jgi:hypothetical protein
MTQALVYLPMAAMAVGTAAMLAGSHVGATGAPGTAWCRWPSRLSRRRKARGVSPREFATGGVATPSTVTAPPFLAVITYGSTPGRHSMLPRNRQMALIGQLHDWRIILLSVT